MKIWNRFLPDASPRTRIIIFAVFLVALILRLYFALAFSSPFDHLEGGYYSKVAIEGAIDTQHAPLYPLFLKVIYLIFGKFNNRAVFAFQGVISSLTVLLVFTTVMRLRNEAAGLIAAMIFTIYTNFIIYMMNVMDESFAILIVVAIMATATAQLGDKDKAVNYAILLGLGAMVKPLLLLLTPGMLIAVKKRIVFLLLLIAILAPWTVRNSIIESKPVPVYHKNALRVGMRNYAHAYIKWDVVDRIYRSASSVLKRGLYPGLKRNAKVNKNFINSAEYMYGPIMILGFIGLIVHYKREHRVLVIPVLGYILLLIFFTRFQLKFRVPLEPLLIVYAAVLLAGCRIRKSRADIAS